MREPIGKITCPFHQSSTAAEVKRNKNGDLYYWCLQCGPVQPHGESFQNWIIDNARKPRERKAHA